MAFVGTTLLTPDMAVKPTQPLTDMSTRNLPGGGGGGGKRAAALKADSLTAICESIV
jgi:hypothetical protein